MELTSGGRRLLYVVGTDEGPRVDWDAYVRYGTAAWELFLQGEVAEATVRVFPSASDYFDGSFKDREKWSAYALKSPEH